MAKTIASGVGITNDWLASQGVLSLKTLWSELAHLRGTALCESACKVVRGGCPSTGILTRSRKFLSRKREVLETGLERSTIHRMR